MRVESERAMAGVLITLAIALCGAGVALVLHVPVPWFTGPLLAIAFANMAARKLRAVPYARDAGQWIIGTALGLYFTPDVVRMVLHLAPWIAANLAFCVVLGGVGALLLRRFTHESGTTSFFAMAIGGASEMAAQAERFGARVDRVAAAHSLRMMMVALIVPFALQTAGVHGADPYEPAGRTFDPVGFLVLLAVTGGGAIVLLRLRAPNVFMIGPLLVTAAITAAGITLSSLPTPVVNSGQVLIGIALGTRFSPEFFRAAPGYLTVVAAITLIYLALAALFGWAVATLSGLNPATAILATTPGGIGEMAITAKLLKLGAPIVTAFHSIRMAALVMIIGAVYRIARMKIGRAGADAPTASDTSPGQVSAGDPTPVARSAKRGEQ